MTKKKCSDEEKIADGKSDERDISKMQDNLFLVTNLINSEEHLYYTAQTTKDRKKKLQYFRMALEVRKIRSKQMRNLIGDIPLGTESWCLTKHLIGTYYRCYEVATKALSMGNEEETLFQLESADEILSVLLALFVLEGVIKRK